MKYLGVDYGKRKVGLSISEGLSASPLKVVEINSLADAMAKISHIIKTENIDELVMGLPDGGESRKITEKFISEMSKVIRVNSISETLSSQNAIKKLIGEGSSQKKRKYEDAVSATLILEEYLDSIKA